MSTGTGNTLADVIKTAIREALVDLHVAIPARVERVDLTRGRIDAKPLLKDIFEVRGKRVVESVPIVSNAPIVWPGAGGMRVTFPIRTGDTVLLVFTDRSLDLWLEHGGEVDPRDPRRHHLSDAIAIPGLRSFREPWAGASSDAITLGSEGGGEHPAAWGDAVAQALQMIKTAFEAHVHVGAAPGSPTSQPVPNFTPPDIPGPLGVGQLPDVESDAVKIRG